MLFARAARGKLGALALTMAAIPALAEAPAPQDLAQATAITLDTSHLAVSGIDIIRAFEELQDRIVHIHLSNNLGTGRDTHSPLTQGVLPIGSLLKRIASAGYTGKT